MREQSFAMSGMRRAMIAINMVVYAGLAFYLFEYGQSWWASIGAGLAVLLGLSAAAQLFNRPLVARVDALGVHVYGQFGSEKSLAWDALTAHTLDPQRRVGALFAEGDGAHEDFAIVSLRMMGREGAAQFVAAVLEGRPDLEDRLNGAPKAE